MKLISFEFYKQLINVFDCKSSTFALKNVSSSSDDDNGKQSNNKQQLERMIKKRV